MDVLGIINVVLGLGHCPPLVSAPLLNDEVMEYIKGLQPHLTVEQYEQLMMKLKSVEPLPTDYALYQNYPNPFNPVTTIEYTLPIADHVKVEVYNVLGQTVTVLVNSFHEAGSHHVQWDASHMSSGIYIYRLKVGTYVSTKKMVYLK